MEVERRQRDKAKIQNFVDIMSSVCCVDKERDSYNSRSGKRLATTEFGVNKRARLRMDTSTPTHMGPYRQSQLVPDEMSPIQNMSSNESSELPGSGDMALGTPTEHWVTLTETTLLQ